MLSRNYFSARKIWLHWCFDLLHGHPVKICQTINLSSPIIFSPVPNLNEIDMSLLTASTLAMHYPHRSAPSSKPTRLPNGWCTSWRIAVARMPRFHSSAEAQDLKEEWRSDERQAAKSCKIHNAFDQQIDQGYSRLIKGTLWDHLHPCL